MNKPPVVLIIKDGWGQAPAGAGNAIRNGRTLHSDYYETHFPTCHIDTSGESVGLPVGTQGNSEVGHLNIGAGRVVFQSLTRIDESIKSKEFFQNVTILEAIKRTKAKGSTLHLLGLIQEEGVHAVTRHGLAILQMCRDNGLTDVLVHAITDGRDTPPRSAVEHVAFLQQGIDRIGVGRIASVMGRYYAMDRDHRWERTERAYRALIHAEGASANNWQDAISDACREGENDEFIKPRIINHAGIRPDDSIIFFNFRFDRTRQLTRSICDPAFDEFPVFANRIHFVAMTHYYDNGNFKEIFPEIEYKNILGEVLSTAGLKQLRCAETEKFAHVTFFFNALKNDPFPGEERILVDSPRVATYDLQPEMSAMEVKQQLIEAIKSRRFDVIICNFANCDMVGHTGIYPAIIKAVETVDSCVHEVVSAALAQSGTCIITADHGNAEQTKLADGTPMTAHSLNPVPLTIIGQQKITLNCSGRLCDVAPTMLDLLGISKPEEMSGISLLIKKG